MELIAAFALLATAFGFGALFIAAVENGKPWARDMARGLAMFNGQSAALELIREERRVELATARPSAIADSEPANEPNRLVA